MLFHGSTAHFLLLNSGQLELSFLKLMDLVLNLGFSQIHRLVAVLPQVNLSFYTPYCSFQMLGQPLERFGGINLKLVKTAAIPLKSWLQIERFYISRNRRRYGPKTVAYLSVLIGIDFKRHWLGSFHLLK